jgi:hypothetical protein
MPGARQGAARRGAGGKRQRRGMRREMSGRIRS